MNPTDKTILLAELSNETCQLNHGPGKEAPKAVNYIIQMFGIKDGVSEIIKEKMVIPVCLECWKAVSEKPINWTLFYCLDCASSQWVSRKHCNLSYRHRILWMRGCPECTGKLDGLYFTDPDKEINGMPVLSGVKYAL